MACSKPSPIRYAQEAHPPRPRTWLGAPALSLGQGLEVRIRPVKAGCQRDLHTRTQGPQGSFSLILLCWKTELNCTVDNTGLAPLPTPMPQPTPAPPASPSPSSSSSTTLSSPSSSAVSRPTMQRMASRRVRR